MASDDYMSEAYVAELLKKDAKESSKRYSTLGVGALMPTRPTLRAPKPNTKFLQNIIRDTNSHNAALKAKEAEDAAARLGRLHGAKRQEYGRLSIPDDHDNLHRSKRRRIEGREDEDAPSRHRRRSRSPEASRRSHRDHDRDTRRHRHRHRSRNSLSDGESDRERRRTRRDRSRSRGDRDRYRDRERRRTHRSRSRSEDRAHKSRHHDSVNKKERHDRSPGRDISKAFDSAKRRRHRKSRSRSRSRSRSDSVETRKASKDVRSETGHRRDLSPQHHGTRARRQAGSDPEKKHPDSDSDPLEAIIGPAPPPPPPKVKSRGRGATKNSSGIDARFASNYDPAVDVHPNSDSEDDWDQALEALQDRQRWKQQGADRLRAAGFTEKEVSTWEKGGVRNEDDVRWAKEGEGREWDRGKVVTADGVSTAPEWGRLT